MNSLPGSLDAAAWERLFSEYDILNQIDAHGQFEIGIGAAVGVIQTFFRSFGWW